MNTFPHSFVGDAYQPFCFGTDSTNAVHLAGVTDVTIFLQSDVEIHNIPLFKHIQSRRHAMTDHVIHRGVEGELEAILTFTGGAGGW